MSYSSHNAANAVARRIARSALDVGSGQSRLHRCHALLRQLDPDRPPVTAQPREFRFQCRALRERVHLYSERLAVVKEAHRAHDHALQKAEAAIELSLQYFRDALNTERHLDDDGDDDA